MKEKNKIKESMGVIGIVLLCFLIVYVISLISPLVWAFITSFKDNTDFRTNVIGLPKEWIWNYSIVFQEFYVEVVTESGMEYVGFSVLFMNSILYAIGCAFFQTLIPCLTAYGCAKFPYKFSKIVYTTVIVVMILPIVGNAPAEMAMAKALGVYDHIWGVWLMKANFLGMYFLVFYSSFKSLPNAYTEAAKIDGASNFRIMVLIILPLIKNLFASILLINFINFWNDYQTPLLYLPSHPTAAQGVYNLAFTTKNHLAKIPMRMAGAMILFVPIFLIFILFQKRLLGNVTMGGIKG